MEDREFIQKVEGVMNEIENTRGIHNRGDLFAIWFGTYILGYEEDDVAELYHIGGSGDEKIDLGIIDDEQEIIFVVQVKYSSDPDRAIFNRDHIDEVLTALRRLENEPNIGNDRRRRFARQYHQKKDKYPTRLIFVCLGKLTTDAKNYAKDKNVKIYDFERLKQEYSRLENPAEFRIPEYVSFPIAGESYLKYGDTIIFIVDVNKIYDVFKKYGPGLLEENIRYKLSTTKKWKIAEDIKETLRNKPDKFLILNNGINMVCGQVEERDERLLLYEPQIVNGCQTVYGIYETIEDYGKIEDAYVVVKVVQTHDRELREKITFAANYQNPILPRDLKSNDYWQRSIQRAFEDKSIFYERKRGEWDLLRRERRHGRFRIRGQIYRKIDNVLCGQLYLSLAGDPATAKNKKELIFSDPQYYETIFDYDNRDWSSIGLTDPKLLNGIDRFIDDLIFAYGVYKLTSSIGKYIYREKKERFSDKNNPVYREVSRKEFLKGYWDFYVVRIFHYIVEHYAGNDEGKRYELRKKLVGDYLHDSNALNRLFEPHRQVSRYFNVDEDLSRADILDPDNPSREYPLFGKWFSSLEQIVYDIVRDEMDKPDWKNFNYYFYKKRDTLDNIIGRLMRILVSSRQRRLDFPVDLLENK